MDQDSPQERDCWGRFMELATAHAHFAMRLCSLTCAR